MEGKMKSGKKEVSRRGLEDRVHISILIIPFLIWGILVAVSSITTKECFGSVVSIFLIIFCFYTLWVAWFSRKETFKEY
jgi:hypothetical protein